MPVAPHNNFCDLRNIVAAKFIWLWQGNEHARTAKCKQVSSAMFLSHINWPSQPRTTSVQTHLSAVDLNLEHFRTRLRPSGLDHSQTIHAQHPVVKALSPALQIPFLLRMMRAQQQRLRSSALLIAKVIQIPASSLQVRTQSLPARFLIHLPLGAVPKAQERQAVREEAEEVAACPLLDLTQHHLRCHPSTSFQPSSTLLES